MTPRFRQWAALALKFCLVLVSALATLFALIQGFTQVTENRELKRIADTLQTGQPDQDIQAVVDFVYQNAYVSEGKYGILRASALDVLSPQIGGQCGDFVRLTINLLNQMGYPARRVYLFPASESGQAFNPRTQVSFHVLAEIWTGEKWVVVDALRGIVFRDSEQNLVTIDALAAQPDIIERAMEARPEEIHRTIWGSVDVTSIDLYPELYANPQRLNWTYLARIPGAFEVTRSILGDQLSQVPVPLFLEQPHTLLFTLSLLLAVIAGSLSAFIRTPLSVRALLTSHLNENNLRRQEYPESSGD